MPDEINGVGLFARQVRKQYPGAVDVFRHDLRCGIAVTRRERLDYQPVIVDKLLQIIAIAQRKQSERGNPGKEIPDQFVQDLIP